MQFKVFHFHGSEKIIESKIMLADLAMTSDYIFTILQNVQLAYTLLRTALDNMGWHMGDVWNIIGGHDYRYIGCKKGVGMEACLGAYMYLIEGLFRLQLGYDKGQIDAGILLLSTRGAPLDLFKDLEEMITRDMAALSPTISLPVCVCLYDFRQYDADKMKF